MARKQSSGVEQFMKGIPQDALFDFLYPQKFKSAMETVVELLVAVDKDGNPDNGVRLKAAQEILNRVSGRPKESVSHEIEDNLAQIFIGNLKGKS